MRIVAADPSHISHLARHMRSDDVRECAAMGRKPGDALAHALGASLWAVTVIDEKPEAMLGIAPLNMMTGEGVPWMLGTEAIYDNPRLLIRWSPGFLAEMFKSFDRLENVVASDNDRAISFLRHLGFTIAPKEETIGGLSFVRFEYVQSRDFDRSRNSNPDGGTSVLRDRSSATG